MNKRILVIEDNPVNLDLMDYALRAFGWQPVAAMRGEDGLAQARMQRPALVLCDIQMPGMDGYELARQFKADPDLARVPLIAVTAYAMVGDREKVMAAGFDGYLTKPIDPASLADTVATGAAQSADEPPPPPATAQPPQAAASRGATILVLDDEDLNLELNRDLLKPLGYRTITASDMDDAFELALARRPDLILSDVGLTAAHGFDFLRMVRAREELRRVPFMFITATHWDPAMRKEGLALGADRFLYRPIEPQQLLAEIRGCLQEGRGRAAAGT